MKHEPRFYSCYGPSVAQVEGLELCDDPQEQWREKPVSTPKCMNCGQPAIFKLRAGQWLVCGKCRAKVEAANACPVPEKVAS